MTVFTLTTDPDTFVGGSEDDTVNGTAATLNPGDRLTGGGGNDVLALYGSGTFRVDQLATFTGFSTITLNNFTSGEASLYLGSQSIAVAGYGSGLNRIISTSPSIWNAADNMDGGSNGFLQLNWAGSDNAIYDLTSNTLTHISYLFGNGSGLILRIDSDVAAGVTNFYAFGTNSQLATSDATLDLSHSLVTGFTVTSTNPSGTTFTVQNVGTAFQIAGGPGQDTIVANGFAFTADQRNAIFATASIEKIIDASGTYTAPSPNPPPPPPPPPPPSPSVFTLTTGPDTFVGGLEDDTVNGTAATLNPGDRLTGGGGNDVVALYGSGLFRVDQLATFTGFSSITLNNFTSGGATLFLGNQPIAVTGYGSGSEDLRLGSGAITFHGGTGYNAIYSSSASNWNAANAIDGGSQGALGLNSFNADNAIYDLTTNTFAHISYLYGYGLNLALKINSADAGGVANFSGSGTNDQLVTSDATLDLSHSSVSGFAVASTNASGTIFTVQDVGTAFQIAGGAGQDTIVANGFAFTANQRNAIFTTASIEKIVDASGTYTAPPQNPSVFTLTAGPDTFVGGPEDDTVNGTAATLNPGDRLTGGGGNDVVALYGSGLFRVGQLATFTGFSSITLNNFTSGGATLFLGNQPIAVTGYGSGSEDLRLGSGAITFHGGTFRGSEHQRERHDIHGAGCRYRLSDRRGAGQDTIVANGFAFTANQRNAIFTTASIEKIVDASGTYTAPPQNPSVFTLTAGPDTFVGGPEDDTVNGTAATLNPGDRLTGGGGNDVVALYGSGLFRVDQLATFTGFSSITLNNFTSGGATLFLGNQPIAVTGYGSGSEDLRLGSGAITFHGGTGYNAIYSSSASNWNAANAIDGGSQGALGLNSFNADNAIYDLTTNTFVHISYLYGYGLNLALKINSADASGVANFSGSGTNDQLVTSDATLDLSHSSVSGFAVGSTNTSGTTFTVQDIGTAFQIAGGPGQDTVVARGFAFTADQRNAIFATASVEKIVDASGTYAALQSPPPPPPPPPPPSPSVFTLTTGPDTFAGGPEDDTVNGTAATLNAGDRLTGGGGNDVLALYGSGTFHVDQLAVFTGFASIALNNFSSGLAELDLGSQPIAVTGYGSGSERLYLGSGAITFQGGGGSNTIFSTSASTWNAGNVIDGSSQGYLYLNQNGSANATNDLTTNTLTHISYVFGNGANLTLKIDSADAAGVSSFYGQGTNEQLVTSDAALDLSHSSVSGFTVASTNTSGTAFTVQDVGTAFQIAGGPGQDTIVANGFAFTADQRNAIFATASVETIADGSGTYTAPPPPSGVFTLTTGPDTFVGGAEDDTVNGTTATLNAGDRLTGGGGNDVLALYGSGTFNVDQLAVFTGFASIALNNFSSGLAELDLGSQPIAVTGYGSGSERLYLGSGAITFQGGGGSNTIFSTSASTWNAGNVIDGSSQGYLYLNQNGSANATNDLTTNTLTHISYVFGNGANLTLKIDSADAAGVSSFYGQGTNEQLVTSDAALDLSHSSVSGFTVASTNTSGTAFTVQDVGTAFQIAGGPGQDTIVANGFAFTADQRNAIFATASVETIADGSGTYTAPPPPSGVFTLTTGPDTFVGGAEDDTVNGTAATLNAGDRLTGGGGNDVLALYGSGTFNVDQLAVFTGFASIALNNFSSGLAELDLGSQPIAVTGYGSGSERLYLGSGAITFQGGGGSNTIFSTSASTWNAGNVIDGSSQGYLYLNQNGSANATYDLTTNTLTHISYVFGNGANLTLKIDSADAAGVSSFYGQGTNEQLVTSDAALDLSHSSVSGFTVASTNASGTAFTVQDVGTAFQIAGGPGQDTIVASGFAFTTDQRNAIFATASIEKIIDTSGTYTASPEDGPPSFSAVATSASFTEESAAVTLAPSLSVSAPNNENLTSAAISITSGTFANDGDVLATTTTGTNITATYDGTTETLTLSGSDTPADYSQVLAGVTFTGGENPTNYGSNTSRTVTWAINDGQQSNNTVTVTSTVNIIAVNDPPALSGLTNASFIGKGAAVTLSGNVTVSDPDSLNLAGATVSITGGTFAGDRDALNAVTTNTSVTASYDSSTETLTLTGSDTLAHYQQVLESVTFMSSSPNPTHYGANPTRTVSWVLNDGGANNSLSAPATTMVNIVATSPVDSPPLLTVSNISAAHGQSFAASSLFTASDSDGDAIAQYDFWNTEAGGGHFATNGQALGANQDNYVSAAQLALTTYQSGSGADTLWVRVNDGRQWSSWSQSFNVTAPVDSGPVAVPVRTDVSASHGQSFAASALFTASDPFGDAITAYDFWNMGSGGAHFAVNGQTLGASQENYVSASQLAQTTYQSGSGADTLWVRVSDGDQWSPWSQSFTVTAPVDTGPVAVPTTPNLSAAHGQSFAASSLFTASDPFGDTITQYDFWNTGSGGGHFVLNNQVLGASQENYIAAAQLSQTAYQSGSGTDTLWVRVSDGNAWSGWSQRLTVTAPLDGGPVVAPSNANVSASHNQSFAASSLFTASDPFGDPISQYDFWNTGSGGGHFVLNGMAEAANQHNYVSAAQLAQTDYQSGSGADTLWVRVSDGDAWSPWSQSFTVAAPVDTGPVAVPVRTDVSAAHGQSFAASSLFTASDPFGDAITQYDFWNSGSGGGHFLLNNLALGASQENFISAAQLAQTAYQSGSGADTLWVRVSDGEAWSAWSQSFTVTAPIDTGPVVTSVSNIKTTAGQSFAASSLFTASDPFGDAISQYDFWDTGAGGGHFALNGQALGANQENVVSAAQLASTTYVSGPGTDTLWVRVSEGGQWSAWSPSFTVSDPTTIGAGETLELTSASSDAITFTADTGTLELDNPASFAGSVAGMSGQDMIDFADIDASKVQPPSYSGDASGGTLRVTDGVHAANIALLGNYLAAAFVTSSDGHGGTSVTEAAVHGGVTPLVTQPHA